jgi:hypothetical protein
MAEGKGTRKRKASSAVDEDRNPQLALAQSITAIRKSQDAFKKAVEQCGTLIDGVFSDIDVKMKTKHTELAELDLEFENRRKQRKIDLDQEIQEQGLAAAKKLLAERGQKAINEEEYGNLVGEHSDLKAKFDQKLAEGLKAERERLNAEEQAFKKVVELEQKSHLAKYTAQIEQQKQQIGVLESTIVSLKGDM